jgi:hypothetical protein
VCSKKRRLIYRHIEKEIFMTDQTISEITPDYIARIEGALNLSVRVVNVVAQDFYHANFLVSLEGKELEKYKFHFFDTILQAEANREALDALAASADKLNLSILSASPVCPRELKGGLKNFSGTDSLFMQFVTNFKKDDLHTIYGKIGLDGYLQFLIFMALLTTKVPNLRHMLGQKFKTQLLKSWDANKASIIYRAAPPEQLKAVLGSLPIAVPVF